MNKISFLLCLIVLIASCKSASNTNAVEAPDGDDMKQVEVQQPSFTNISVDDAKALISTNKDLVIIDVRTPEEIAQGKIEGALEYNINDPQFLNNINKLDKTKEYLVYCKAGGRSANAMTTMKNNGFINIKNMSGGYDSYSQSK